MDALLEAGCPAGPINTIDQVAADPQIAGDREMFVEVDHPTAGHMKITGNQIKLTNHKIDEFRPAPLLGADNEDVLGRLLGYSAEEVEKLGEDGVL